MSKKIYGALAAVAASALLLTACGGSSTSTESSAAPAASEAAAPAESAAAPAAVAKIGVILPDAASSARWETADRKFLTEAFTAAGVEFDIQNANGDKAKFATIADQMLASGVSAMLIVNLDSPSAAAVVAKAAAQGVPVIDYDRLTLGGGSNYYVSFDNVAVGTKIGEGLVKCMGDNGNASGPVALLNGSPTDNNATIFEQMYTKANGDFVGVASANDGLGGSVIAVLDRNGQAGKIPVTGQDATDEGLQRVLLGTQCMSVYKAIKAEAEAAAALAIALSNGDTAAADALATGKTADSETGMDVASVLLVPVAIYPENVKDVIADGFTTADKLCTTDELKAACAKYGVQ